jgi:hypothetical protein
MDTMMEDDRDFESMLRTLREADAPPPTPRDAMWLRIQAERAARLNGAATRGRSDDHGEGGTGDRTGHAGGSTDDRSVLALPRRRMRGTPWVQWGAALAAMLVIGIGLGRVSMQQTTTSPSAPAGTAADAAAVDAVPTPYRLAATQHLHRTEALLASLVMDARTRGAAEISGWAADLLTDTRLLLASPAAQDPALERLLNDLELVLSQIAGIPAARASEEVELIQDGLNQSDVLLRLRAATTVRRTVGT